MTHIERMRLVRDEFRLREATDDKFQTKRWATVEEAELLYTLTCDNNIQRVVEIGTANGWTAAWFALAGATVYTFDVSPRPKMYLDSAFPFPDLVEFIKFQLIPSPACIQTLPHYSAPTLWFIDADHTYTPAKADFDAVRAVARPRDFIVQHDATGERGSARVWAETVALNLGPSKLYTTRNGIGVVRVGH